jgi:hypothetical protein
MEDERSRIMPAKQLTYEGVLKMFRKSDLRLKKQGDEFDRRMKETERIVQETAKQQAKTDQTVERVSTDIGKLGNRIGDIIEHMVGGGNIVQQFRALDYAVTEYSRNKVFGTKNSTESGEIDLFLEDGDIAILISVKTKLTTEYVHEHIEQLEKYRRHIDAKGNGDKRRFIGAIAGAVADQNVIDFAQKKGLYVIVQSGVAVEIVSTPENFRAKEW